MESIHDIAVHYKWNLTFIIGVDPDFYSIIDLVKDVTTVALSHILPTVPLSLFLSCVVPGSSARIHVDSDKDVLEMFKVNASKRLIDLYIGKVVTDVSPEFALIETMEFDDRTFDDSNVNDNDDSNVRDNETNVNENNGGQPEDEYDLEDDNDIFGFSSEDEEWENIGKGKNPVHNDDVTRNVEEEKNHSEDGMSDYESGDEPGTESDNDMYGEEEECEINVTEQKTETARGKSYVSCLKRIPFERGLDIKLEEGYLFVNVNHFRDILVDFCVQKGCTIKRVKNEKQRVTVRCAVKGCPWRVYASRLVDKVTYQLKTIRGLHNYVRSGTVRDATSTWIAKKLGQTIKDNPGVPLDALHATVMNQFKVDARPKQLYRAKRKVMDELEGNHGEAYTLLSKYANGIFKSNPGSIMKLERDLPTMTFKRIFMSLEAMQFGFKNGCRGFIGLDGCHLKTPYGGVILSTIALNGNNGLFPLAVAVVENEGK
ncbi:uncharacterized protein LOC132295788 [Cornus florida]|uniref:uncharacterized protein LOC132295788 n=1 Tax=Cornus florida TaxID=4283 RepID=UPI00289C53D0|nr:uncharacterized protein LOC132295788 [Cornus florida]